MLRDIFTNKWTLGGVAFLIVFAVTCVFLYQHDTSADRQAAVDAEKLLHQLKVSQKSNTNNVTEEETKTPAESSTSSAEKPTTDVVLDAGTSPEAATANIEEVRVSPNGFGPYPDIPKGAPVNPFSGREGRNMELLMRVVIKKWNQGERFRGASFHDGKVYLNYPNTVYVRYGEPVENADGSITRPISSAGGSNSAFISEHQMRTGQIPLDLRVLEYEKNGIDPYECLDLP